MNNYRVLWHLITNRIAANHRIVFPSDGTWTQSNPAEARVFLRSMQIFSLELTLANYREKHASLFEPLYGKAALHHKILAQTHWRLTEISALSLSDCLFVIQDDLRFEQMSLDAQTFLKNRGLPIAALVLEPAQEADWDPLESLTYWSTP